MMKMNLVRITTVSAVLLLLHLGDVGFLLAEGLSSRVTTPEYIEPPPEAALDLYAATIRFSFYATDKGTGSNQTSGRKMKIQQQFSLPSVTASPGDEEGDVMVVFPSTYDTHGSETQMELQLKMLVAAITLDIAAAVDADPSDVRVQIKNATALVVLIQTVQGERVHNAIAAAMRGNMLLNRSILIAHQIIFPSPTSSSSPINMTSDGNLMFLRAVSIDQLFRYRTDLEIELIDPMAISNGGLSSASPAVWSTREILFPSVVRALEQDLRNLLTIRQLYSELRPGQLFYPVAEVPDTFTTVKVLTAEKILFEGSARRVKAHVAVEMFNPEEAPQIRYYLLGRHSLPSVTAALQRVLHPEAAAECIVRNPGERPPPRDACGPGCYISAILWCCVVLVIVAIIFVGWGGPTSADDAVFLPPAEGSPSRQASVAQQAPPTHQLAGYQTQPARSVGFNLPPQLVQGATSRSVTPRGQTMPHFFTAGGMAPAAGAGKAASLRPTAATGGIGSVPRAGAPGGPPVPQFFGARKGH